MSCDHLVCAACAHPVSQGRCDTCRATRAELHSSAYTTLGPALLVLLALLVLAAAVTAHVTG